ncbi:MAG: Tad domain-containing protein, partial [Robiginitomaculum sp.]
MTKQYLKQSFLQRFKQDTRGTFAVIWAVSMTAVVFTVGAAYDYTKLSAAHMKAQDISDMVALSAAVYIRDHEGDAPDDDAKGFRDGQKYYVEDALGINLDPYVNSSRNADGSTDERERPSFKVRYDYPTSGQVQVIVEGQSKPAFMSIVGVGMLDFSSKSNVSYKTNDIKDPATVILVLDNSGSMGWADGGRYASGTRRITSLKASVKDFMVKLDTLLASRTNAQQGVLRTGLAPYSSHFISEKAVAPNWQEPVLTNQQVNAMSAGGATNSSGAMAQAKTWMDGENTAHRIEHGNDEPLKYVVFMTDGVNDTTGQTCTAITGHWHYRHYYYGTISHKSYESWYAGWDRVWVKKSDEDSGSNRYYWEEQQKCTNYSAYDSQTVASCNAMKQMTPPVKIYSIGYALTINSSTPQWRRDEVAQAQALLKGCATDDPNDAYFYDAAD